MCLPTVHPSCATATPTPALYLRRHTPPHTYTLTCPVLATSLGWGPRVSLGLGSEGAAAAEQSPGPHPQEEGCEGKRGSSEAS